MKRRNLVSISMVLAFVALLTAAPAPARVQDATPVFATPAASPVASPATDVLPETPVGRQLAWVIDALKERDSALAEAEIVEHLAPEFLASVPAPQVVAVVQQIATAYGPFSFAGFIQPPTDTDAVGTIVGRAGDPFTVTISVEPAPPHRIVALLLEPGDVSAATPEALASWDDLEGRMRALAPQVNFLAAEITDGTCRSVHAIDAGRQLAIGSTFKLYVLGELAHQVEQGTATWNEELAIRDDWKSLPSGTMQDEPAGTVHPLRVYAEQMISISDNTATDHLLLRLGRENVEAF